MAIGTIGQNSVAGTSRYQGETQLLIPSEAKHHTLTAKAGFSEACRSRRASPANAQRRKKSTFGFPEGLPLRLCVLARKGFF
jgi:hypothetical protein